MHPWFFYVVLQNSCTTVHCPCEYVRGIDDDDDDDVYLEEGNVFIIILLMYALIFFNIDGLVIQQYIYVIPLMYEYLLWIHLNNHLEYVSI